MTDLSSLKEKLTPKGQDLLEVTIDRKGKEWVAEHEDLILAQAKKVGHRVENTMRFTEEQGKLYQRIIDYLSPPDGTATSTAELEKELDWEREDIHGAVMDLIAFDELELVNTSQYARVRLRQPTPSEQLTLEDMTEYVWHAYIIEQKIGKTRARRLFTSKEAGEAHLKQIANVDELTAVPNVSHVWCASIGSKGYTPEYAVLRKDPIFRQADDPYPDV
ncbi:hypothetical protein [Halapricum desulfuricans]|uniref:Uncharacterized protein n=1 Tax=Halapricum desulfuricans TaxID=2841257 RepID=A0A897NV91_9EURY|nr:hypothetical protein [Halapricum desulfuricans]QSG16354.1 hypothetical protein HSEST_3090 [Halapricum desulfuricans]